MYKEDIPMMNDEVLMKDPAYGTQRIVKLSIGLSLIAPQMVQGMPSRFAVVNETRIEQRLYDLYSDTPLVSLEEGQVVDLLPVELGEKLNDIEALREGWDGYHGAAIDKRVVSNARRFITTMAADGLEIASVDDIYPTPYGTIVVEYHNDHGLVSMEISGTQVGYFTDYPGCGNYGSRGIDTDFNSIPEELKLQLVS